MKSTSWFGTLKQSHWSNLQRLNDNLHILLSNPLTSNAAWCEKVRLTLESIAAYNVPRD